MKMVVSVQFGALWAWASIEVEAELRDGESNVAICKFLTLRVTDALTRVVEMTEDIKAQAIAAIKAEVNVRLGGGTPR